MIVGHGCKFAPRCPHVMAICRGQAPPLYHSAGSGVACYLYRDAPLLGDGILAQTGSDRGGLVGARREAGEGPSG